MSQRRELERHRRSLGEIRDIMNAMKNLAYMETHKISGFLDVQHAVVKHIETVAVDFLNFHPEALIESKNTPAEVYLLIGAERGFCGDFNQALLQHAEAIINTHDANKLHLISVGHKLENLLQDDHRTVAYIDGASVAEEVDKVLNEIVNQLTAIHEQYGTLNLSAVYHSDEQQIITQTLLPSFQHLLEQKTTETHPPQLNLEPRKFLFELSYQYLFAALYEILYTSLMAESRRRLSHLEGTVQHMDEQAEELHRQENVLRQEEIIEEIEVILLSASSLDDQPANY